MTEEILFGRGGIGTIYSMQQLLGYDLQFINPVSSIEDYDQITTNNSVFVHKTVNFIFMDTMLVLFQMATQLIDLNDVIKMISAVVKERNLYFDRYKASNWGFIYPWFLGMFCKIAVMCFFL